MLATLDGHAQRAALRLYTPQQQRWGQPLLLPERDYALASLCLYRDDASNIYLFLLGEEGQGEQWLVGQGQQLHASAQRVRGLPLPANASYCQVDDASHQLFVSEEGVGLWRYGAHPEADAGRQMVDLVQPFGGLSGNPAAMASVPGGLLLLDSTAAALHSPLATACTV